MNMTKPVGYWTALLALTVIHVGVLGAGFLAPYDFATQDREAPFAPPVRLHFLDASGRFHFRPFVCRWAPELGETDRFLYTEDCTQIFPIKFFVGAEDAGQSADGRSRNLNPAAGVSAGKLRLFGVDSPGRVSLLGTDEYGRDVFSRLIYGGRISLFAGLAATLVSLALGWVLGSVAGFYGSWIDEGVMRGGELFLALPWLYLLFAVRAFLPLQVGPSEAFLLMAGVIGIVGWARPARLIRGIVLSAKERTYVLAARGFGASDAYILRRHIWPETRGVMLTQAALLVPAYIQAEIVMSFFGLGVAEPTPSWGNMLMTLQNLTTLSNYWWMASPALVLAGVYLLYHAVGTHLGAQRRA
jgi:peptide/nickel transport system permease protein